MPVIGVPCLNRPDLLVKFMESVPRDWDIEVIRNGVWAVSGTRWFDSVTPASNLGTAASWNLHIRTHPDADYWVIANDDTVLAPGDLDRLVESVEKPGARWVGMNGDWRVFAINRECVEVVGFFDENFHPIYCEDADYERRCNLAGALWYHVTGGATHEGSATIRDPKYAEANARTYPANRAYYAAKWGVDVRQEGGFTTPFNRGGSVRDWSLDLERLRSLAW